MKKLYTFLIIALLSLCGLKSYASDADSTRIDFISDVRFDMNFDNREFVRSDFSPSMTIFGARFIPTVGFSVKHSEQVRHKLMFGVDVMKDFGSPSDSPLFRELNMYYLLQKKSGKTAFSLQAGIFPRSSMEAYYSEAFFSDSLKFYDNNLEGLMLKFHRPKAYFELGCDWMGQYGQNQRERFMIFTGGSGKVLPFMSIGYSAYMYHFANSHQVKGVVDNFLVNPYLKFDFAEKLDAQIFSLRAGWIQNLQNDRRNVGHYIFTGGAELDFEVKKWNVGLRKKFYMGKPLMPLYNSCDIAGDMYGGDLYYGDPFYLLNDDGSTGAGVYDRFDAYYDLKLKDFLKLRVTASFHFTHEKYAGCQQMVRVIFDLQELMDK